ncbi:ankyrin, partial [Saccharata proteae CBS 121410]
MHEIPARVTAVASKEAESRRSPVTTDENIHAARKTNGVPEGRANKGAQENGGNSRKASSTYSSEQSRTSDVNNARAPPQTSARNSSQSPPRQRDQRARSSSTTDSRKRKLRDDSQAPGGTEPPRQRHKTEGLARSVHRTQASSPISSGVKAHKRSASTQSLIQVGGRKRRRSPLERKDWTDDDDEDDDASSPHPHSNVPAFSRPRRSAHRSMTSPVRTLPPKKKDAFGATRLLRSCEKGDFEAVKAAYDQSPDELDTPDYAGITPLQKASLNGHDDIVQFLLEKDCQTDCHDFVDQDTPLIDAVCNGHLEVVKLLLWKAKVDPTHENKLGKTALALLDPDIDEAKEIREELQKAVAEKRKDRSEDDDDDRSPIEEPTVPTLLPNEYNAEVLRIKSEQGDKRAVDELLASGIMPNVACGVAAARGGHDEILSFLLATGLSADHRDPAKHNETPMLVAIKKGHLNVIRLLLAQEEFDPTRTNRAGLTYFQFAQEEEGPNWREIHNVLEKAYDDHMRLKQKKRIRSPRLDRSELKSSPRRRPSDQDRRAHESRES